MQTLETSIRARDEQTGGLIDPSHPSPTFFVVGAVKAGTTSLHAYLNRHPDVFMSSFKEPHYFASFVLRPEFNNFYPIVRDRREYQQLFHGSDGCRIVGEASPSYLYDEAAPARIKAAVPAAKILISLRNPVERAFSHYLHELREGRETRPFQDALDADAARTEKGWGISFQYVEQGLYADRVERYLSTFGPKNVHIILFEDFVRDTPGTMKNIAHFLDVDPLAFPENAFETAHNPFEASRGAGARWVLRQPWIREPAKRLVPRSLRQLVRNNILMSKVEKPSLAPDVRSTLAKSFHADLLRLERLLDRELSALKESA